MARLRDLEGSLHFLDASHVVGRSRSAQTVLTAADVSAHHLAVNWNGTEWTVRDLASRNGTWVDGRPIGAGEVVGLKLGSVLGVGSPSASLTLVEDGPPCARATSGETSVEGGPDLLALPSADDPVVLFQLDPEVGWTVSEGEESRPVGSGVEVAADGRRWRISLPEPVVGTVDARRPAATGDLALRFRVSGDEEYVELTAVVGGQAHVLPARTYQEILLALARVRLADAELPPADRGWVYTNRLMKMLRLSSNQLYVGMHRVRRELAALGVPGDTIERRSTTHQVRLGVEDVQVAPM